MASRLEAPGPCLSRVRRVSRANLQQRPCDSCSRRELPSETFNPPLLSCCCCFTKIKTPAPWGSQTGVLDRQQHAGNLDQLGIAGKLVRGKVLRERQQKHCSCTSLTFPRRLVGAPSAALAVDMAFAIKNCPLNGAFVPR